MGYPDVVAYALDHLRVNPRLKDNAGIPPIHRAAYKVSLFTSYVCLLLNQLLCPNFKGHADIVDMLLRYGVDPNTNVKGEQ